jgi:hypothetical protein
VGVVSPALGVAVSLFNRHIASLLPKLAWRHFGVGALQAYLHEGEHTEQRLHIWHPALIRPGIRDHGDCHDHRFSFKSEVLCGSLMNEPWTVYDNPIGVFDVYEVENARAAKQRTGSHDGDTSPVSRASAIVGKPLVLHGGSSYEFHRGEFHRSFFTGTTVTLVTKFDQQATRARILCPHGKPLVHAFGGPEPDIRLVLLEAQGALSR